MGIQINGNNDIISALDGSWTAEGASINTSGILTATTFKGNIVGTAATFTGPVTIGGTLTYEDVTNIDSVGLITARDGIDCNGDLDVDGHTNLDNVSVAGVTTFQGTLVSLGVIDLADTIAHASDPNTKIRFPSNDTVSVETSGSERLRITSAGKVGINTASPRAVLDVEGNAENATLMLHSNDANANLQFSDNTGGARILNYGGDLAFRTGTNAHAFGTGDNEKLRIQSGGDVLIGTTTSAGKLTVDSGTSNTCATFQSSDAGAGINVKDNHARSSIEQNATTLKISADTGGEYANSDIRLQVDGSTKTLIDSNGDIFIGTTTDIAPSNGTNLCVSDATISRLILEKQSTIKFGLNVSNGFTIYDETNDKSRFNIDSSGNITAVNTTSGSTTGVTLKVGASAASGTNSGTIIINNGGLGNASLQFDYEGSAARAKIYTYRSTNDIIFDTSGTEKYRFKDTGEFHISDRNSANTGEHFFQAGAFGIRMQDTGGYNRWNIERNYGGFQSTPLVHFSAQGRVGINQASPGSVLNVKAIGSASDGLQVTSSSHSSYVWQIQNNDNLFNGSLAGELGIRGSSGISFSANAGTSTQFRITSGGQVQLPINGQELAIGASQQYRMFWENSESRGYIKTNGAYGLAFRINNGNRIEINGTTGDVTMQGASGRNFNWDNSDASLYLTDNNSGSSARLKVGSGGDLQLYHDTSGMNHITCANNHELKISSLKLSVYDYTGGTQRLTIEDTHPTFILGNATSKSFQVRKNGTLNTAALQCIASFWHSGGTTSSDKRYIAVSSSPDGVYGCHIGSYNDGTNPGWLQPGFYVATGHNSYLPNDHSIRFKISSNGNFYGSSTTISSISDARLKKNITNYTYDLNKFKQLQPKTFEWINPAEHCDDVKRGFSAQEVEVVDDYWILEDRVDKDSKDKDLLDSDRIAKNSKLGELDAMYVSVINQLISKIETLETKVAALEGS